MVPNIAKGAVEPEEKFVSETLPGDLEELHTEVACRTYGMMQNMLQEDLVHSIAKRAVEFVRNFIGGTLPNVLEEPIPRDERLHT